MIRLEDLEMLGVAPSFLEQIGKECEQVTAFAPSFEPLPISAEMEQLLGIPPIPAGIKDPQLLKLYYAIRQQKYHYKLQQLAGCFVFNGQTLNAFNNVQSPHAKRVALILLGKKKFNLDIIIEYPFKNSVLENTTIF